MARIIIADLSHKVIHRQTPKINFMKELSDQSLKLVCGGKNKDFYYLLNYLVAGLAIYSIKSIVDSFD